ncbi:MAG: hypothetical protein JEY71_12720 [Sphaerochaeta sp.]|nr:hypothetical protein [Sphaerochaeta sp.]
MQVETVISKEPVRTVIEAAKKALYTGHIGDDYFFLKLFDASRKTYVRNPKTNKIPQGL